MAHRANKLWHISMVLLVAHVSARYVNNWDRTATMDCPSGSIISSITSYHNNRAEDRRWAFNCRKASKPTSGCKWTPYVNDWDRLLAFMCSPNQVIAGMTSYHNNGKEDRRFKFKCCNVGAQTTENCRITGYVNNWDGVMKFNVPANGAAIGAISEHRDGIEDRRWKFIVCDLKDPPKPPPPPATTASPPTCKIVTPPPTTPTTTTTTTTTPATTTTTPTTTTTTPTTTTTTTPTTTTTTPTTTTTTPTTTTTTTTPSTTTSSTTQPPTTASQLFAYSNKSDDSNDTMVNSNYTDSSKFITCGSYTTSTILLNDEELRKCRQILSKESSSSSPESTSFLIPLFGVITVVMFLVAIVAIGLYIRERRRQSMKLSPEYEGIIENDTRFNMHDYAVPNDCQ